MLAPSLTTLTGSFLSDQDRAYTATAARPSPRAGHSPTPQRFVRGRCLSLDRAQRTHSGVDGAPGRQVALLVSHVGQLFSFNLLGGLLPERGLWGPSTPSRNFLGDPHECRGVASPIQLPSVPPGPGTPYADRARETRAVSASPTPTVLCLLGRRPTGAPSPRQVLRESTIRLRGPGAAAVARGPPALSPERPAASRNATASSERRGRKPPPAQDGPPPSLAQLGPAEEVRPRRQPVRDPALALR
ncbi:hypothetical protein NDU88_003652 [Pleurodeles waltl]|uniref:Uncharacterized protein n=1 Tax=Pleurodeles waltl TaxID=8319 RepID=A0AAV7LJ25_PLEWA|nr:hypothetical protein NDU88_003652 [Pleurodeles waltl]